MTRRQANACELANAFSLSQMIPKRVFSPSLTLKSLTSENRLKGNRRFDCDSQASSSSSISSNSISSNIIVVVNNKPSLDPIKEAASIELDKKVIGKVNIENGKSIHDKNNSTNKLYNDVSHCEKDKTQNDQCYSQAVAPKTSANEIVNNLIGTQETVVEVGNCHRNIHISHRDVASNERQGNEAVDKIELSGKRCDVETKINNVPLRDVIQRNVTKLPNQLLNSSKELSTKLATAAASTTSKNVSRTKRLLFRRKTTAITKDQFEVAKQQHLVKNWPSSTGQNNEVSNECGFEALQVKETVIESNYRLAIDAIQVTADEQSAPPFEHQHHQSSTSAKQKQTNNITIVTNLPNAKRKNAKTDNKHKLDDVNRNTESSIAVTLATANDNVSTSKRYYFKQTPAANKIKSEHFASNTTSNTDTSTQNHDNFQAISNKAKIINERKPLKPPPYIDPPSPLSSARNATSGTFNKQTNYSSSELQKIFKNNKAESDIQNAQVDMYGSQSGSNIDDDDEHGNYAVPYVQSPTQINVSSPPTVVVNSTVHIRIANQSGVDAKAKTNNQCAEKSTHVTKSQNHNNRALLSRQQQHNRLPAQTQCKDNKDSSHDKSSIESEILLVDPIGQSFSSSSSSNSSNSSSTTSTSSDSGTANENDKITKINSVEANQRAKMDPSNIMNLTSPCDMLTKPEFSSSHLQNIPVRPRKGIPHLENYCLFDPSKDFVNEKELKKKYGLVSGDCMPFPIKILDKRNNDEELIKETIYEDHDFVYDTLEDVKEEDEEEMDEMPASYPNYFTIDPDYIEENKKESLFGNANHLHPIVESEIEDIYSDTNANLNRTNIYENQHANQKPETTHVPLKKSPQIEKIVRQTSQPVISTFAAKRMISSTSNGKPPAIKNDSSPPKYQNPKVPSKIRTKLSPPTDLPLRTNNQNAMKVTSKKRNSMTMKHSVSTPQLSLKDLFDENVALPVVEIEIRPTASNKNASSISSASNRLSQCKFRRPASQHSDGADSGFLSPATPTSDAAAFNFPQLDSIQGYIDVSSKKISIQITIHSPFEMRFVNVKIK